MVIVRTTDRRGFRRVLILGSSGFRGWRGVAWRLWLGALVVGVAYAYLA